MLKFLLYTLFCILSADAVAQTAKTEMYDLVKKLLDDSTGYENVGDWAVKIPVKWKSDELKMSDDTAINFYRLGIADITIRGKTYLTSGQKAVWNIMLKGPRMGYTSFSILSSTSNELHPKFTIDSLFGNKPFTSKLEKSCDGNSAAGFYFYSLKLAKKEHASILIATMNGEKIVTYKSKSFDKYFQKKKP